MTNHTNIEPFIIAIPEVDLDDLRERLRRTRWPQHETGWERGVPIDYLEQLAGYWLEQFDWREQERKLNAIPQFTTTIDGQPIHFLHIRSPEPEALPLLLTHGWPSSPVEFLKVIGPLTDPAAHGANPADAFDLVIPSLPGYGFSTPVTEPGWGNLFRVAQAWAELMSRLGYGRYAVHGTDVGSGVADLLAMIAADRVVGTHLTGTVGVAVFAADTTIRSVMDPHGAIERWSEFDRGGHFPAMETPELLTNDLRDFFHKHH